VALEKTVFVAAAPGDPLIPVDDRDMRILIDAVADEGVAGWNDYRVTQRAAGANQSVDIAAGIAVVKGDTQSGQGKYAQRNDAVINFTDIPAPPSSGTQTYVIVLQINDKRNNVGTTYDPQIIRLAQGVNTVPTNAMPLAKITRRAGQSSVLTADILDMRPDSRYQSSGSFIFTGGNGRAIPRGENLYRPFAVSSVVNCTVADQTTATVTGMRPGLWMFTLTGRMNAPATGPYECYAKRTGTSGAARVTGPRVDNAAGGTIPVAASQLLDIRTGDVMSAYFWQDAVTQTNLNDVFADLRFSGFRVGGIPGVV
jgi:hypothetical protein